MNQCDILKQMAFAQIMVNIVFTTGWILALWSK